MKRRVVLVALSILTVAILILADGFVALVAQAVDPVASTAQPGPASPGLSASSPTDDVIPPVAERIFDLGKDGGFAGQRTDYKNRAITVFWKGTAPTDVHDYVASRPFGVNVTLVEGAKYSRAEGNAARTRIWNASIATEIGIVSISVKGDGSGLVTGITQATQLSDAKTRELKSTAGIEEIQVDLGRSQPKAFVASRTNDAPPWKGGARMILGGAELCSTGFAVLVGSYGRLVSARHCDTTANLAITDGAGQSIAPGGSSVAGIGDIDSLLIDPSASPATTPKVYSGAYNSTTLKTVKNWYSNWPGDPVCASGASTGTHCGTIYDDSQNINFNGYVVNVIQASAPSGSIMAGQGDSGGPVYKTVTGGVQARGIVLGPDTDFAQTTSCGTVNPDAAPIVCSRYLNYVPISTILNTWGVTLEVG
jgi:hypothetical protein